MARTGTDSGASNPANAQENIVFQADGQDRIELPSSDFIADAKMTREGDNLILQTPAGETVVIEGYFTADPAPILQSDDGATLTPNLVDAFSRSPFEFAAGESANDESPVGAVEEVKGNATVTRADGTVETITIGTPIYQGDIVETDASGAVNIVFIDETSMAVSENARLAIDEYTFDPATESGTTNFSVLRGLFVFTSGLIGRDDPDDVSIDTPVGSIGIRGTVIAGEINPSGESKITVLEGAIVVKNGLMETVLSEQFETVSLQGYNDNITTIGVVPAQDISNRFNSIGDVNPGLFTTINDAAREESSLQQPSVNDSSTTSEPVSSSETPPSGAQETETSVSTVSATPTTVVQETATSPVPVETAPAPVEITTEIVTLDGNTSNLPTIETAAGQPSGGLANSNTVSGTVSTPVASSPTTSATGGSLSTPLPTSSTGTSAQPVTTEPPTSVADTTQPPPSVTSPQSPTTTVTQPPVFAVAFTGGVFNDLTETSTTIGTVSSSGTSGVVTYTITSTNDYFEIDSATGEVRLSTLGVQQLSGSLDVEQLGDFTVTATSTTGETIDRTYTTTVTDAHGTGQTISLDGTLAGRQAAIISDTINNGIGYTITALGDINNDGFDDFAFSNDTAITGQNHSYILYGRSGEFTSANLTSLSPLTPSNQTTTAGNLYYSTSIAGIGDFNGDGIEDYIIGQPENNSSLTSSGAISIISGAASNPLLVGTNTTPVPAGSLFGQSVSGIGDFNNDGHSDVIIGAPGSDNAYYLAGRSSGWSTNILTQSTALTGSAGDSFGSSVAGIGDFNGDGYSDFAVGAPTLAGNSGAAYIYTGNASSGPSTRLTINGSSGQALGQEVSYAGDLNGDGYSDMFIGGDGNIGRIVFGSDSGTGGSVSLDIPTTSYNITGAGGVGDFNGDGYDDMAISMADPDGTRTYVVFGKDNWSSTISITDLKDPDFAFEISYSGANNSNDIDISSIGDIDGDGYDDFAMSLPDANGASAGNGGLAIIYGRDTGAVTQTGTNLTATANDDVLVGGTGDDVFNDGNRDGVTMRGGAGADIFRISSTNFLGIHGGSQGSTGYDKIRAMDDLDFTDVNFEQISGIEGIDFGANDLTVTLTIENLFNLMKTSKDGILKIENFGANGSVLVLTDDNGTDNVVGDANSPGQVQGFLAGLMDPPVGLTSETEGSVAYDVFQIGGYRLMIDNTLTVDAQ